jgi:hypothetical protein
MLDFIGMIIMAALMVLVVNTLITFMDVSGSLSGSLKQTFYCLILTGQREP